MGERTRLFGALTVAIGAATAGLVVWRGAPIAPPWAIAAIALPWLGFTVLLRARRETWGRELPYFDLWSFSHLVAGLLLAIAGIGLVWVFALVVAWELIELACRIGEYPTNRVSDAIVALAAWALGQVVFAGGHPLW